eukprot:tig00000880_g5163.t1
MHRVRVLVFFVLLLLPAARGFDLNGLWSNIAGFRWGSPGRSLDIEEDARRNVSELISARGYPVEEHLAEARDGFILSLQRIPHGAQRPGTAAGEPGNRPVIFLQHGLLGSSAHWVENFADQSLAFILADAGFDVWLGNSRGNVYSRAHLPFDANGNAARGHDDMRLWDFSWDEMALLDLPAAIDYVLRASGAPQLAYVGHSQGATILLAALAADGELAAAISFAALLAPVAYAGHSRSPLLNLLARLHVDTAWNLFGRGAFAPSNAFIRRLFPQICAFEPRFCESVFFFICGFDEAGLNQTRVPVYASHSPAGTSVKNMVHWAQAVRTNLFQRYDYGAKGNLEKYGAFSPPAYSLGAVPRSVPLAFFTGGRDWLADPEDAARTRAELPGVVFDFDVPEWDHLDFIWAVDAHRLVYPHVVRLARQHAPPPPPR